MTTMYVYQKHVVAPMNLNITLVLSTGNSRVILKINLK